MAGVEVVDSYVHGALRFDLLRATSNCDQHPSTSITAPGQTVILGGGAFVEWEGPCAISPVPDGNLITGMFPSDDGTRWFVKSKDHINPSPASIVAYCIVAQMKDGTPIPRDAYNIVHDTSPILAHPTLTVRLPEGFHIVGGGANVNYEGAGNILYASYPTPDKAGWVGSAKDHLVSDPATITVWAIGLKESFLDQASLLTDLVLTSKTSPAPVNHPRFTVVVPDLHMTGGGAHVDKEDPGNLLTACFPQDRQTWIAEAKDHEAFGPSTITVYAIGFKSQ